ncbi:unnamed protein product [Brachionus calyciflorus]|uniref:HTH CENPB-type domain-containing protein n=1 Tax=Brachionus calyciflorus TaxID=104777 RepID=A0A813R926_9BILA|nr:unnamed protein product [Brachionus calyciflorus]
MDANNRKRKKILNSTKVEIIKEKQKTNKSDYELAKMFEVDRSTITKILKKKETYLNENSTFKDGKKCRLQKGYFPLVEEALYDWVTVTRQNSIPIPVYILKEKALEFYNKLKNENIPMKDNFEASDGWVRNFLERFQLASKLFSGESESAAVQEIPKFIDKLKALLESYSPDNIYNADETGLFFRLGPNRTIAKKNENCKGSKKDKSRITILFAANVTGSNKVKPFVIGKSIRPRCMKYTDFSTLPVRYSANDSAWMTGEKWIGWLKWFDSQLNEPSLLLVDNCPAHVDVSKINFRNLKIEYLPPNTTSLIQPMDAGIIRTFKSYYRKLLVCHLVKSFDAKKKIEPVSIKKCIEFIDDAWYSVDQLTIKRCWAHTKILPEAIVNQLGDITRNQNILKEIETSNVMSELKKIDENYDMNFNEYVDVDSICGTFYVPEVGEILENVLEKNGYVRRSENTEVQEDEDVVDDEESEYISHQLGFEAFQKFCKFLEQFSSVKSDDLRYIKNVFSKVETEQLKNLKQLTLFDILRLNK